MKTNIIRACCGQWCRWGSHNPWGRVGPKRTESVVGSFGPDSSVLAKGSVLVPRYEMCE